MEFWQNTTDPQRCPQCPLEVEDRKPSVCPSCHANLSSCKDCKQFSSASVSDFWFSYTRVNSPEDADASIAKSDELLAEAQKLLASLYEERLRIDDLLSPAKRIDVSN
jgi:predicted amidophosphoribosyltransferase